MEYKNEWKLIFFTTRRNWILSYYFVNIMKKRKRNKKICLNYIRIWKIRLKFLFKVSTLYFGRIDRTIWESYCTRSAGRQACQATFRFDCSGQDNPSRHTGSPWTGYILSWMNFTRRLLRVASARFRNTTFLERRNFLGQRAYIFQGDIAISLPVALL